MGCGLSKENVAAAGSKEKAEDVAAVNFDVSKDTASQYADQSAGTLEKHAYERKELDYDYHNHYSRARQQVQDDIIDKLAEKNVNSETPLLPWVLFTAGAMGAGKGRVRKWMTQQNFLPMQHFTVVDPDQIRMMLPEWNQYVEADPSTAGMLTQKEAGTIAEILTFRTLRAGRNVLVDGSLRDWQWYRKYFQWIRDSFPGMRIGIIHVTASPDNVIARAKARGERTGRVIPLEFLVNVLKQVPISVSHVQDMADFCVRVNNDGEVPLLEREPGAEHPPIDVTINWDWFESMWLNSDLDINGDGDIDLKELDVAKREGRVGKNTLMKALTQKDIQDMRETYREAEGMD